MSRRVIITFNQGQDGIAGHEAAELFVKIAKDLIDTELAESSEGASIAWRRTVGMLGAALDGDIVESIALGEDENGLAERLNQHMFNTHEFEPINGQKHYAAKGLSKLLEDWREGRNG